MHNLKIAIASLFLAGAATAMFGAGKVTDAEAEPGRPAARDKQLRAHHDKCVDLFVKTAGAGRGRMIVLSHASPSYPKHLDLPALTGPGNAKWEMERVELVSLLKGMPGVYPAEGMSRFRRAPKVRDLDTFENRALERLKGSEQMQVEASASRVRVLGAIRMQKACMSCHAGKKEGDLLGAFTYSFKPAK